eukprot:CAMPEP_0197829226 /NCGR_PEP_ID=MMETSP1437-20131217/5658_1 /TAXON_ID=49252 ORGANISM="Eucampia antarctica, Strain CCMP1452" /NCGR_SAMPLE_ID=MMETSP1437 /ASSEMBLY_ACC=CAM_ASM_001096 /LENGTH=721 /DNA_ID=CAMNT_0043430767 /DNA_START=59 /DNA_END=2225 /DNA_ORIENTATION=-
MANRSLVILLLSVSKFAWGYIPHSLSSKGYLIEKKPSYFSRSHGGYLSAIPPGGVETDASIEDIESKKSLPLNSIISPKVNEIDFCMAPSDVSLSRSYGTATTSSNNFDEQQQPRKQSLTRSLNSVSNRAIRRILLSRSWPSPEALNLSLRQVLSSSSTSEPSTDEVTTSEKTAKCPVPRPILNVIMKREDNDSSLTSGPRTKRTDEQWVSEQMQGFRESYSALDDYELADAYLESILNLATSGLESPRVSEMLAGGVYDDSYRRVLSVIKSVGAVFETVPESAPPRMRIASKLLDQDICLSMIDKLAFQNKKKILNLTVTNNSTDDAKYSPEPIKEMKNEVQLPEIEEDRNEPTLVNNEEKMPTNDFKGFRKLMFWAKEKEPVKILNITNENSANITVSVTSEQSDLQKQIESIKPEDLGGVLLSAEEPTVTRQLNVLSNIVKRALLFGGDQELLVLFETLEADKATFIQKWYPDTHNENKLDDCNTEQRPGVQYFNCLVRLLKDCYVNGSISDFDPPYPLKLSYQNSYERLTALLVELGSGYFKPMNTKKILSVVPKTPSEEFGRFAQWEVNFRQTIPDTYAYPDDLLGSWQVRDEISGKLIGKSTVIFKPDGEVSVASPLKGMRWRLDPGPTHLDTCTFQVLSDDGAILQYKGFVDRGARLEARFSKRSIKIRGGVTFQMRDGDAASMGDDFTRDMLPITTQTGTTRFVMSKVFDLES